MHDGARIAEWFGYKRTVAIPTYPHTEQSINWIRFLFNFPAEVIFRLTKSYYYFISSGLFFFANRWQLLLCSHSLSLGGTKSTQKRKQEWMNRRGSEKKMNRTNMNVNGTNLQFFLIVDYTCELLPLHLFSAIALFMPTPDKTREKLKFETAFFFALTGKIFKRKCCHLQTNHHFVHMPIRPTQQQCHGNERRFNQY